jgi:uncharacterized OB-fold protein
MNASKSADGIPAIPGLFTWPSDEPALIASRCAGCATYCFPYVGSCINPACTNKMVEQAMLSRRGVLWSFTIHHYKPPPPFSCPEPFVPFAIGVIELPENIKVLAMLAVSDPESLQIGVPVQMVVDAVGEDAMGNQLLTWKFALCEELPDA